MEQLTGTVTHCLFIKKWGVITSPFNPYIERNSGSFQRSFQLPTAVKGDKVEATFDKGVLKVTIPKAEEAEKKEIEIKVK